MDFQVLDSDEEITFLKEQINLCIAGGISLEELVARTWNQARGQYSKLRAEDLYR